MKKSLLKYSAPELELFEVAAECGFTDSSSLPSFGTEDDELASSFLYPFFME